MTPEDSIYRFRLRALALAEELGNVRLACRAMGIHHSTFYRWKRQVEQYGLDLLRPRERRRSQMANATSPLVEQRVVAFALGHRGFRPGAHRGQAGAAHVGRHPAFGEQRLAGAQAARAEHPGQASESGRRLRRSTRTGAGGGPTGAPSGGRPTR